MYMTKLRKIPLKEIQPPQKDMCSIITASVALEDLEKCKKWAIFRWHCCMLITLCISFGEQWRCGCCRGRRHLDRSWTGMWWGVELAVTAAITYSHNGAAGGLGSPLLPPAGGLNCEWPRSHPPQLSASESSAFKNTNTVVPSVQNCSCTQRGVSP